MAVKNRGSGFGKSRAGTLADLRSAALRNRYIQRLIEDEELRASLIAAYAAGRSAYGRISSNGRPTSRALFENRKVQKDLRTAANALRDAASTLREPPPKRRRRGPGRALLLILVAGALALVLSEGLRSKVLDLLFGAEEEFDYSSTTTPAEPAPATTPAS